VGLAAGVLAAVRSNPTQVRAWPNNSVQSFLPPAIAVALPYMSDQAADSGPSFHHPAWMSDKKENPGRYDTL